MKTIINATNFPYLTLLRQQMIMGAGKTTVVGPLLAMLLANSGTLMLEVVPPALLDFSAGVLRERFRDRKSVV